MFSIRPCPHPETSYLKAYSSRPDHYTDCFETTAVDEVSLTELVEAFFTSPVLRLERKLLGLAGMPSTTAAVTALANGAGTKVSGWETEQRDENQLLLAIFQNGIRTWLMVERDGTGTKLFFGSAVVPKNAGSENPKLGWWVNAFMGFHLLYSRIVLAAAKFQVRRMKRRAATA
ncbi:hypothetical protein [Cognatishimia activa]|uniref:DUF2867 domain-containing protein n=1 Tax=Cognatishimia activa TaxID=1715691 RepID=A0A0P1IQV9_9RHOB|nr:hypothetical protein [Cognatishimia activa]CUI95273.1 hypothetical protein TA5113_01866 [Cognatishimia activa]CUK25907.1 hypothetical protein TA5114_01711 [Cognatishimia activa]